MRTGVARGHLYERQYELEALERALDDARGGAGAVVSLLGPAGIGKSRLVSSALELARTKGMETLVAASAEPELEFPFAVTLQLFERPVHGVGPDERAQLFTGAAGLARPLFGGDFEVGDVNTAPARLFALIHGLFWLCSNLSERAPLLIAVDDLHWCDEPSLRYLLYLGQRIAELPAVLLISARPGDGAAAQELLDPLIGDPRGHVLRPPPLTSAAVGAVIEEELGVHADDPFVAACAHVTGGNPFFMRELLAALRSEGFEVWGADPGRVLALVPSSLNQRLLMRVMRLAEPAPTLARALSILGDRASLRHAAALAGVDLASAGAAADALARTEVLDPALLRSDGTISFTHPIVRNAIYSDQPVAERRRLHSEAARLLLSDHAPPEAIAAQLLLGEPGADPRAVECLRAAARLAATRASPGAAARLLGRALAEPLDSAQRARLLGELAELEIAAGQVDSAERHARDALLLVEHAEARARSQQLRGRALSTAGRFAEAADAFEQGLAEVPEESELGRELRASFTAMCLLDGSLRARALPYAPMIVPVPDPTPTERTLMARLAAYRALQATDSREQVKALVEHAWGEGTLLEASGADGDGWPPLCIALSCCEYFEEAIEISHAALEDARQRGSVTGFATASFCRGFPRLGRGQLVEAIADLEAALQAREMGWERWTGAASAFLVRARLERAELAAAADALAIIDQPRMQGSIEQALLLEARAELRLAGGDATEALADAREAGRRLHERFTVLTPYVPWRATAARAALALADRVAARALIDEELELSRRLRAPALIARGLRIGGLIEGGQSGLCLLDQAVESLPEDPPRLERTRALLDLGSALRRGNKRGAAAQPLHQAHEQAHSAGATVLAERARAELAALGSRARKDPTARDRLTASERRVAEMAQQGLTNKEIAQSLFITVKAVEWHLGHAYQKLNITSRKQLGQALRRTDPSAPTLLGAAS